MIWTYRILTIVFCCYIATGIGWIVAGFCWLFDWGCLTPGLWTAGTIITIGMAINICYGILDSKEVKILTRRTDFSYDEIAEAIHVWGVRPRDIKLCRHRQDFYVLLNNQKRRRNYGDIA